MGKKKATKLADNEKMSAYASSFNGAVALSEEGADVDDVLDLTLELYEARIEQMQGLGLGGGSGNSSGGAPRNNARGGSSGGGSGKASQKQVSFAGDLVEAIEDEDGDPVYSVKDVKKMSIGDAKEAITELIEQRDDLQG